MPNPLARPWSRSGSAFPNFSASDNVWWTAKPLAGRDTFFRNWNGKSYWYNGYTWLEIPKDPYIANVSVLVHSVGATVHKFGGYGAEGVGHVAVGNCAMQLNPLGTAVGLQLGTGDYTIEGWAWVDSFTNNGPFVDMRPNGGGGNSPIIYSTASGVFAFYLGGANRITSAASAVPTSTYFHYVVSRASGVTKMGINGAQAGSNYTDANTYFSGCRLYLNQDYLQTSGMPVMYQEEFRLTKGVARYTFPYTVPATPFSDY